MTTGLPLAGLTVTTPWYPTQASPSGGSFVTDWTGLARSLTRDIRVLHAQEWPGGEPDALEAVRADVTGVLARMASRGELDVTGRWSTVTRVPTLITTGLDIVDRAEAQVEALRSFGGAIESPVVHGHIGYLGGLAAARLAPTDSRVIVTEHSSGLGDVLATSRGRDLYAEVLDRAHRLTCVSTTVRDLILSACPGHDETVVVMPNPVNFEPEHQREAPLESLDRWVFSGHLGENKGVRRLLGAFILFAADRPSATLDLYGAGPLLDELRELAQEGAVADRVTFHGAVTHHEMLQALTTYDVLIAPSRYETFHLVVPEAVAAGIPVVVTRSGGPQEALSGVEDLVGAFIDVNDDPAELCAAVLDVEGRLDRLDLPRARQLLGARYGHDATRSALADLYDCADLRLPTDLVVTPPDQPEHLVVSITSWRAYAAAADLDALRAANAEAVLLTDDPALGFGRRSIPAEAPSDYLRARQREAARALAAQSEASQQTPPASDAERRQSRIHVIEDVGAFTFASALLKIDPDATLGLELNRERLGLPPVDAPTASTDGSALTQALRVSIWGSCVTRDTLALGGTWDTEVDYHARSSWISQAAPAVSPPVEVPPGRGFVHRMIREDLTKSILERTADAKPDLVVFDLIDERFDVIDVAGSRYSVNDCYSHNGLEEPMRAASERTTQFQDAERDDEFAEAVKVLAPQWLAALPSTTFVLHRSWYTARSLHPEGHGFYATAPQAVKWANERLARHYAVLEKEFGNRLKVVEPDPAAHLIADPDHRWGLAHYHYAPSYYETTMAQLKQVAAGAPPVIRRLQVPSPAESGAVAPRPAPVPSSLSRRVVKRGRRLTGRAVRLAKRTVGRLGR